MKVSFKGFKNAAYQEYYNKQPKILHTNEANVFVPVLNCKVFHVELDNENENDLDEFQSVLNEYPDENDSKMLNIEYLDVFDRNKVIDTQTYVNGYPLRLDGDTLRTFIKMHKAMKKISKMDKNDIVVENEHLNKASSFNPFVRFLNLVNGSEYGYGLSLEDASLIVSQAYNGERVKIGSKRLCERLSEDLTDFFQSGR